MNREINILSLGIKQESRVIISNFPLQVKNQESKSKYLFGKELRFLDPLLDRKHEWRNEIKDFERRNIKNWERIMITHP
jgi:hypothetical protein